MVFTSRTEPSCRIVTRSGDSDVTPDPLVGALAGADSATLDERLWYDVGSRDKRVSASRCAVLGTRSILDGDKRFQSRIAQAVNAIIKNESTEQSCRSVR
jgi:hypothetical protein